MSRGAADRIDMTVHPTGPREVLGIGVPSFGMVHLFWHARMYNMRHPMNRIVRQFYIVGKEVGHARNEIVAKALAVEKDDPSVKCTRLLFVDDDLLFHPDALLKLLQHNRPIVSGLYYTKTSVPTPLVLHGEFGGTARSWKPGDVIECDGHGMGLCLIDTEVFRRMRDELDLGVDPFGYPNWFETIKDSVIERPGGVVHGNYNATEDWTFLQRARSLGYQPCVDTSPQTFAWHLDTKNMSVFPQKQWSEFLKTGNVTWDTDDGPIVWTDVA